MSILKKFNKSVHYDYIDLLRTVFCLAVLFYHLGSVRGGFLAVCGFFVVSGFFAASSVSKDNFRILEHYKKRFVKLYIPLLVVVCLTVLACRACDLFWISLKPETNSILAGYNNFYQIAVGDDYFARANETPFIHLWYIAILLQVELLFPLIVFTGKKLFGKLKADKLRLICLAALALSTAYFVFSYNAKGITVGYYGTFERLYSFILGVTAFVFKRDGAETRNKRLSLAAFFSLLALMIAAFFVFDSSCSVMPLIMLAFSLFTAAAIWFAGDLKSDKRLMVFNSVSSISYELYLVHYPVMFIWNELFYHKELAWVNTAAVVLFSFLIAALLHVLLGAKKDSNPFIILLAVCLAMSTVIGGYFYVCEPDHTEEMNELKELLADNAAEMEQHRQEYLEKQNADKERWAEILSHYSDDDFSDRAADAVSISAVGDSILLGASPALYNVFDNIYIDAQVSRPGLYVRAILEEMYANGMLGEAIFVHIGANGGLWDDQVAEIMDFVCATGRQIFWMTVTNDKSYSVFCNDGIRYACEIYDNSHLIDWEWISYGHPEWFVGDGIHVNEYGAWFYADAVYNAIHGYYRDKYEAEKTAALSEYNDSENSKYSFYGNDLLLSLNRSLSESFADASFNADGEMTFQALAERLKADSDAGLLTRNVVILTDAQLPPAAEDLELLGEVLAGRNVYVAALAAMPEGFETAENLHYTDLSDLLSDRYDNFYPDGIHLSETGIEKASQRILEALGK